MKFIDAQYNDGCSIVTVKHNGKAYYGISLLHPDDKKDGKENEFTGCRIAETRAMISAYREERDNLINDRKIILDFLKQCTQYKNWNEEEGNCKFIAKQLEYLDRDILQLDLTIKDLKKGLEYTLNKHDALIERMKKKKDKTK